MRCLQYCLRYCILSALLLLAPAAAWGVPRVCTFGSGVSTVGPIATETGVGSDCAAGSGPITADDTIICGAGCRLAITDDIILDGSGANPTCIQVLNGGEFTIDVSGHTTAPDTIGIETFQGCSVGAYGNVSLYVDSTSTLITQGGCLQNGEDATPAVVGCLSNDNWTTWTLDTISPCGGDCVTYPNLECFIYTNARSNVQGGSAGESHLDHALAAITAGEMQMRITDLDGRGAASPEFPRTYPIATVDSVNPYSICIDITEPGWETGGYRTEELTGYTVAHRGINATTLAADAAVGATCVTVAAGTLSANGDYVGRWFRPDGESDEPYRIMWSVDGVDCDGGAAGDALYLPDETPIHTALASASDATIDYGFARGQTFAVSAPVIISGSDNAALSDADQKIVIEGTANIDGLEVHGAGELRFNGATIQRCVDIHTRDTGTDGYAAIAFEDVSGVTCSKISTMGGDGSTQGATGQAAAVLFDDVAGAITINDGSFRYFGDGGFITSGTTATGSVAGSRLTFEHILSDATNIGPLEFGSDDLARVALADVNESDAVAGTGGDAVKAGTNPVYVDRLSILGQVNGGMGTGGGLSLHNLFGEWVISAFTGLVAGPTHNILPIRCSNCEIWHLRATSATGWLNPYTSHYQDFIFSDFISHEDTNGMLLVGRGMYYDNGVIWNATNDSGGCAASDCPQVKASFDGDPDTDDVFTRITIGWDPGTTTDYSWVWSYSTGFTGEDRFDFGSVGVWNLTNSTRTGGYAQAWEGGTDLETGMGDGTVVWAGPLCMQGNVASGGATWQDAPASFLAAATGSHLFRGYVHPLFNDTLRGDYSLVKGSLADEKRCGALTGNQAPGVNRYVMQFGFSAIGGASPMRPLIVSKRGAY